MTRDQLEAVIWRHWPTRGTEAERAVDAILDAAGRYALTQNSPTRARRAVLMEETAAWQRDQAAVRARARRATANREAVS